MIDFLDDIPLSLPEAVIEDMRKRFVETVSNFQERMIFAKMPDFKVSELSDMVRIEKGNRPERLFYEVVKKREKEEDEVVCHVDIKRCVFHEKKSKTKGE